MSGCSVGLRALRLAKQPMLSPFIRSISSQPPKLGTEAAKAQLHPINYEKKSPQKQFPLSVLSTGALIRSMLISTISSNRFLLTPALHTLSFLCKPIGGPLLDVDRNPVLHRILRSTFYDQFCTGETPDEARACVQRLKALGFRGVILTYAKETVYDHLTKTTHLMTSHAPGYDEASEKMLRIDPDIEDWRAGVMETAGCIGKGDYVAIKLTGAGNTVTAAFAAGEGPPRQMLDALDDICAECEKRNVRVIVDAESQHFQKGIDNVTLELMRKFNRGGTAVVYNTYQAYLKSTTDNVINHLSEASKGGFTLGLKVVRGAYLLSDNRALIHDTKEDTDNAYDTIAQGALQRHLGKVGDNRGGSIPFPSVNLLLCSHNRNSLFSALRLHQHRVENNLPTVPLGFGQLHGMSDEVSFSLLQEKGRGSNEPGVLKCSTWGTLGECLAYLLRRAVENRSAVLRTEDEHRALKKEFWRRFKTAILHRG